MKNLKKQTNFNLNVVLVGLDFTVSKDSTIVAMHMSKASCKIPSIKNFR